VDPLLPTRACGSCAAGTPEIRAAAERLPALDPRLAAYLPTLIHDEIMHWCIERMEQGGSEGHIGLTGLRFDEVQARPAGRFRIPFTGSASSVTAVAYDDEHPPPPPRETSGWIEVDRGLAVHGLQAGGWSMRG
jgi:hypothetical protein